MQYKTANGVIVYVDDLTLEKLQAHPDVHELLPEAFSKLEINENLEATKENVNMGRVVGKSGIVDTPDVELNTKTHFAIRTQRKFPSHISNSGKGKPCETVAMSLKKIDDKWALVTAFIGVSSPSEPFYYFDQDSWMYKDERQFKISLDFWMKHALVFEEGVTGNVYESTWAEELEKLKNLP